jgi:hypothetical protein
VLLSLVVVVEQRRLLILIITDADEEEYADAYEGCREYADDDKGRHGSC